MRKEYAQHYKCSFDTILNLQKNVVCNVALKTVYILLQSLQMNVHTRAQAGMARLSGLR